MINKKILVKLCLFILILIAVVAIAPATAQTELSDVEHLGKMLYFDETLSHPDGQSCASCHDPDFGFVDPDSNLPVSEGVTPERFGGRNSPSSAYAMFAPNLYFDEGEGLWIGGQFWDGRATGATLGDPLADQALGPFLNPVEMNGEDLSIDDMKAHVVNTALNGPYGELFEDICGSDVQTAYDCVALSIAAFERTQLFAPFTSKYDAYLADCLSLGGLPDDCSTGAGRVAKRAGKIFSKEEWQGFQLFMGENNNDGVLEKGEGAMCAACHLADWPEMANYTLSVQVPAWAPEGFIPPIFTDFTFDNLGVPKNTEFPFDPSAPPDLGLGAIEFVDGTFSLPDADEEGKFKVMSLRNIGLTPPYAHNGLFKTLKEITHFYNTRDVLGALQKGEDWPSPEYPATVNFDELGDLGLSDADEDALVEFMKTLSDGYSP